MKTKATGAGGGRWTREQIWEEDKRQSAIHEAGHAVMLAVLNSPFYVAFIWPDDSVEDEMTTKLWRGRVICIRPHDRHIAQLVGCSGELAVLLKRDPEFDAFDWQEEYWWEQQNDPHSTDYQLIGDDITIETVEKALNILKANWAAVEKVSVVLLKEGRIESDTVEDIVRSLQ